jgi:DNA-binding transcriptional regulator YdaS (Cro superfamily)
MQHEPTITLAAWLQRAGPAQRAQLVAAAGPSLQYLQQLARGERAASARKAAAIEQATIEISRASPGLPPVLRVSSCAACAACPHARVCRGGGQ